MTEGIGFQQVNQELDELTKTIEATTFQMTEAREKYLLKKGEYKNSLAMHQRQTKLKNPEMTQTDVNAEATNLAYPVYIEMVMADSAYSKRINELRAARDRLDALRELSYNLRKEASIR